MTVIINDEGFSTPEQEITYERADTLNKDTRALDISADQDLNALSDYLETLTLIRIEFSSFADGRGFSLARILRLMGFSGHLRAYGHVISDQYAMARRSGLMMLRCPRPLQHANQRQSGCFDQTGPRMIIKHVCAKAPSKFQQNRVKAK